jgi:hypothetical protein
MLALRDWNIKAHVLPQLIVSTLLAVANIDKVEKRLRQAKGSAESEKTVDTGRDPGLLEGRTETLLVVSRSALSMLRSTCL